MGKAPTTSLPTYLYLCTCSLPPLLPWLNCPHPSLWPTPQLGHQIPNPMHPLLYTEGLSSVNCFSTPGHHQFFPFPLPFPAAYGSAVISPISIKSQKISCDFIFQSSYYHNSLLSLREQKSWWSYPHLLSLISSFLFSLKLLQLIFGSYHSISD